MKEKTRYLLVSVGVLLVIAIGISFAYFLASTQTSGEGAKIDAKTATLGDTTLTVQGTLEFNDLDIYPGHQNISSISVNATGNTTVIYNLIWEGENTLNTPLKYTVYQTTTQMNPSISCEKIEEGTISKRYYETCTSSGIESLGEVIEQGEITTTSASTKFTLVSEEEIKATSEGNNVYYYVILEYPNTNESQNIDMGGSFNGEVTIEIEGAKEITAVDTILANAKMGEGTPDFSKTSCSAGSNNGGDCEEATVGLYEGTENGEPIYYFRGDVDDNWVSFAGYYWRIIRTNSDGSIRMIYAGTDPNVTTGEGTQIGTSAFNTKYNASYYVGLKYTEDEQHGTSIDSTIMGILNTWYTNNLASYASELTSGTGFCNDRDMSSGYSWSATPSSGIYYAAYERLITNKTPTLDCNTASDNFTTSGTGIGNGALQYPIGLITADEVAMAGGKNANNYGYYLYTGQNYWTMSPSYFRGSCAFVLIASSTGYLNTGDVNTTRGVHPVINLRADVTLSGTGTSSDPYVVEGA